MKKILTLALMSIALCGCQQDDKDKFSSQIFIDSVPTGAPIIIDGLKLGAAPISVGVECNEDGCFVKKTVITAIPQEAKFHTQIISFPAYNANDPEKSRVPEKIIFHMDKNPADGNAVVTE